ncbi:hypothetical protein M3148_02095 [Georgenia satyanarayanai]|uniref:hypothetical protein n=1 Tax=Georgenia satyanarayanai TaxID=860221 RepID=UPI0020425EC8|nr:hypothetical protein [Georgenia satyanarayanai]MCM3659791.1 hypothetical protein [Georgenia satyanarayanai]
MTTTAGQFYQELTRGDGDAACHMLAPKTREEVEESADAACATAILTLEIPRVEAAKDTDVFGDQAQVTLDADTAFLARFPDGWKIVAAGCTPDGDLPYQCEMQGS